MLKEEEIINVVQFCTVYGKVFALDIISTHYCDELTNVLHVWKKQFYCSSVIVCAIVMWLLWIFIKMALFHVPFWWTQMCQFWPTCHYKGKSGDASKMAHFLNITHVLWNILFILYLCCVSQCFWYIQKCKFRTLFQNRSFQVRIYRLYETWLNWLILSRISKPKVPSLNSTRKTMLLLLQLFSICYLKRQLSFSLLVYYFTSFLHWLKTCKDGVVLFPIRLYE